MTWQHYGNSGKVLIDEKIFNNPNAYMFFNKCCC